MSYDYVIIGGGVAGLYANYLLTKKKQNCIVLEKNSTVSGRVREHDFHGTKLKCGAGIIVPENKSLVKLLKKLGMKVEFSPAGIKDLITPAFDMDVAVKKVKKVYKTMTKKDLLTLTAREILYKYFEKEFADNFILHSEFEDYLEGSFEYLMKYYPIADLDNQPFESMGGPWTELVDKLSLPNIKTDYTVNTVEKKGNTFCGLLLEVYRLLKAI
jgi:monoamine oxidase